MNVGNFFCKFRVIYNFAFSLPLMAIMGRERLTQILVCVKCPVYKRGCFWSKELLILFCVIIIWWPVGFVWENKIPQGGWVWRRIVS